jgi:hypothetical protein
MPLRGSRRARDSSESGSDMPMNSGVAGRVKERKRIKPNNNQQATTAIGSTTNEGTSRQTTSRQTTSRQTASRQTTSSQDTSRAPATPVPGRWRRVIDPNLPRNLRQVNKSPGETSDEDAPTKEELLAIRALTQNTATNPLGVNEQPQGNSSALTSPEATPQHTPTAVPFEPVSQPNTPNVPGDGAGIESNTAEGGTLTYLSFFNFPRIPIPCRLTPNQISLSFPLQNKA